MTPGWQQIGAVWLPLPHMINMLPVQVDAWYRTGASGVALSVASLALATGALASMLLRVTGSLTAAATGAALMILNPNVLYLQSTPMTEPLLFGLTLLGIAATARWVDDFPARTVTAAGAALAAACLTRYEAWAITGAVVSLAAAVLLRRGHTMRTAGRGIALLALWPAIAIVLFAANSRWVVGEWFVSGGFFVAENVDAIGNPAEAWRQIDEGLALLSGRALVWSGYAGAALVAWDAVRSKPRASLVLLLALAAAAALPMVAYLQGHPFRIRYDLPLVIAAAALAAGGISLLHRRLQPIVAMLLLLMTVREATPLDRDAPLARESQREASAMAGRRAVTGYLQTHYDGATIMMSMGSLGHYMHDLSSIGLGIENFLHEGNGKPWEFAMLGPAGRVGWIVIEEQAEGGDALYRAAKRDRWLKGFERVAEGGGVALYRARR
ncbi:MAG: hypothetical protein H0W18_10920 [Acidobacteria bacterium]|nr:hypothetical protein [Acidobacteriota bacterium]